MLFFALLRFYSCRDIHNSWDLKAVLQYYKSYISAIMGVIQGNREQLI